jgi:hypothetical protein
MRADVAGRGLTRGNICGKSSRLACANSKGAGNRN